MHEFVDYQPGYKVCVSQESTSVVYYLEGIGAHVLDKDIEGLRRRPKVLIHYWEHPFQELPVLDLGLLGKVA